MASKRKQLEQLLQDREAREINADEAARLHATLAPISDSHFRRLLRESGAPLAPLVEGVRQDSLESLERTLLALLRVSESDARREVILARDHVRMAQRRNPSLEREEKILWMTVWLDNPSIFADWLRLRKQVVNSSN